MEENHKQVQEPNAAFEHAIKKGQLSLFDNDGEKFAGNWMYMYSDATKDYFKSIITRQYITVERA